MIKMFNNLQNLRKNEYRQFLLKILNKYFLSKFDFRRCKNVD